MAFLEEKYKKTKNNPSRKNIQFKLRLCSKKLFLITFVHCASLFFILIKSLDLLRKSELYSKHFVALHTSIYTNQYNLIQYTQLLVTSRYGDVKLSTNYRQSSCNNVTLSDLFNLKFSGEGYNCCEIFLYFLKSFPEWKSIVLLSHLINIYRLINNTTQY